MDYSLRSPSTNQTERGMTQFLWQWFVGWHAAKEQRPQLGRAMWWKNRNIFIAPAQTFKLVGREKELFTAADDLSLTPMWKHSCLLYTALGWIIPINVLTILPSWQIQMNAAIGFSLRITYTVQYISEYQCINICGKSCVWSLRASQLHALLIFLLKRPLLFLTIHRNKHPIQTIMPLRAVAVIRHVLSPPVHDSLINIWQASCFNSVQFPAKEICCSLRAELASHMHTAEKKHSINNKKHGPNESQQHEKKSLFIIY